MLRKLGAALVAFALVGGSAEAAPKRNAVARTQPSGGEIDADLQELAAWSQALSQRQDQINISINTMWDAFEAHNRLAQTADQQALTESFGQLLQQIKTTRQEVLSEKANIEATALPKGNVVVAELPKGFLAKTKENAVAFAGGLLEIVDRAETLATAMSVGEVELGKEFALLTMDSSIKLMAKQINTTQSSAEVSPKNSLNAWNMQSLSHVYEALHQLLLQQRAIAAGEANHIDLSLLGNNAADMIDAAAQGKAALKLDRAKFALKSASLPPGLRATAIAQQLSAERWFDYLSTKASELTGYADNGSNASKAEADKVLDLLIEMEEKFFQLRAEMLQRAVE